VTAGGVGEGTLVGGAVVVVGWEAVGTAVGVAVGIAVGAEVGLAPAEQAATSSPARMIESGNRFIVALLREPAGSCARPSRSEGAPTR
jgi:hypothetical protein